MLIGCGKCLSSHFQPSHLIEKINGTIQSARMYCAIYIYVNIYIYIYKQERVE